ncbi:transposase family protein [Streptomyces sp. NPDC058092]|uniref:transposase family protein n=1 Tax=Streptomyces sp. NPDC058092 TaxID=3346336 RepID=UPI0036EEB3A3
MLVYPSAIDLSSSTLQHLSGLLAGHRRRIGSRWRRPTPTLEQAMATVRKKAYVILDGTTLPIDRIAADRPYYSGKKKHHGMNVQVITDPAGRLIWASDALPGATHDLTAARIHGIPAALATVGVKCWADKAYQGAGPSIRVPLRGKHLRGWRRRHNRDHAKIRSLGERAMATLKCWRLLRKLRCSTTRITAVIRAIVALELAS